MSLVPPQASACGEEAGKSQCTDVWPFGSSLDPLSPDATVTVTPSAAASANAWSIAVLDWADHWSSDWPQLIDTATGVGVSCTACGDRVDEPLVGVVREVHLLGGARRHPADDLDVELDLAVRVPAGGVGRAAHPDGGHRRNGKPETGEVGGAGRPACNRRRAR